MAFLEIEGLGKINYHEYGKGEKLLFAFHGYGMLGDQFKVLEKSILQQYRVIGFDQFFHGETEIYDLKESAILASLAPEFITDIINAWFNQFGRQRFSLIGYSIGANMALFLVQKFADQVDNLFLMAPDGLVPHKGFRFLHTSFIGKKVFRKLTFSSWMMAKVLVMLKRVKVIDQSLFAIANREIATPEKRLTAYYTINFIKNIKPDIRKIATLINQHKIRCVLYFGEYDQLFPQQNAHFLLSLLNKPEIYVLPADHWLVTKQLDDFIVAQTA